ncbi:PH domain-containing protein, partial [Thauera aromatica]
MVYQGKVSIWSLVPLLLIGLIFLAFYGLGLLFWIAAAIKHFTTELAITNKRVIAKFGLISRSTIEINLQKIGTSQDSCRLIHATSRSMFLAYWSWRTTASRSGLSVTA